MWHALHPSRTTRGGPFRTTRSTDGRSAAAQRVQIPAEGVQLLIAVSIHPRGIGQRVDEPEVSESIERVRALHDRDIPHQVGDRPLLDQAGVLEEAPLAHADQIGNLRRREQTQVHARRSADRHRMVGARDVLDRHRGDAGDRIRRQPRHREKDPLAEPHAIEQHGGILRRRRLMPEVVGDDAIGREVRPAPP